MKARDNPFATQRVESQLPFDPAWLSTSWESILTDFEKLNYRASVVGPHGSGKTTFLDALIPRLQTEGLTIRRFFFNDQAHPHFAPPDDPATIVIIDGAEQLRLSEWRQFQIVCPRLLITQHRHGKLSTLLKTETTPEMLGAFVKKLAPDLAIDVSKLYRKHKGNLREALLACYDCCTFQK